MSPVPKFRREEYDHIVFGGGLDTVTPPLNLKTGYCRDAQNFEIDINQGYLRMTGYERIDGRPAPSDANYSILAATITGAFAVGNTLTGTPSAATGVIAASTGTYFVLTKVVGTFAAADALDVGAGQIATAVSAQVLNGATTAKLHAQYKNAVADIYRADILAVPGAGRVLGVFNYQDVLYAFRNNAGNTASVLHKATAAGWVAVALGRELAFTSGGGAYTPVEGDTITGATSAATAVVTRVALESGSFAGGTAVGRFIFASQTGVFVAENLNVGANLDVATIAADAVAITLDPGGRYEFDIKDFGGQLASKRVYGCSGVHRGFEFDGTVFVPVNTGMTPDFPLHCAVHEKQLFFSFGSSVQHSAPGTPYIWSPIFGAAELAVGDTVTGFSRVAGSEASGALAVMTQDTTNILYGSGVADWNLVNYNDEQGSIPYTLQSVENRTVHFDARGITSVETTIRYGNFVSSVLSQLIQDRIIASRTKAVASCVVRDKSQYRIFFSDNSALYMTFVNGKLKGFMPQLFVHAVACVFSGEMINSGEVIYFGSTDGFVYQLERGTSADGEDVEAYLVLAWNNQRNVRQRKRYSRILFEVAGDGYSEFNFRYELAYASTDVEQPDNQPAAINFAPVFWDAFVWDQFIWDGASLTPKSLPLGGNAENVSLIVNTKGDYFQPAAFSGAVLDFKRGRAMR